MTDAIEETEFAVELAPDMERVGVTVGNEATASLAEQQAALTLVMRRMKAIQKGLDVQDDAHVLEVRALTDMHHQQTASERARLEAFKRYALNLAELMEWGKKKSHDSPYGSAGVRDSGASVECTDRHSLAMWAAEHAPQFAEYEMTVPVLSALERFSRTELSEMGELDVKWNEIKKTLDPSGELPPGVSMTPAARTPFVKV
ncbi:MAG: hypothetical protein JWL61_5022 [Gemmatimonadetes bacterium]|nr:hypothetical protein [Gemmatimonadota bacterium]